MAISKGTLGYMLQGVSQQHERVQPDGHVRISDNMWPDPIAGVSTRPQGKLVASYAAVESGSGAHTVELEGDLVRICYGTDYVQMLKYSGTEIDVAVAGAALDYFGPNMTFFAVDGEVVCLNRDTVVATVTGDTTGILNWGHIISYGGEFKARYRVYMTYADNTVVEVEIQSDTENQLTSDFVIGNLQDAMEAHPNFKATTTILRQGEVLFIRDSATTFALVTTDGTGDSLLRSGVGIATTFAHIPRFAQHGSIIQVVGETGTVVDDIWLRFYVSASTAIGDGFGEDGVWREWHNPLEADAFNLTTMPHILSKHATLPDTYELTQGDWLGRRVGNRASNPVPSFVGRTITDVGEFSSRVWFISGGYWIASRTEDPRDFFRKTATAQVATDPVDIKSSTDDDITLEWGIPYDRNLLLFALNGQFLITGGTSLTPTNAAMTKTTNFDMSPSARPTVAGQTVMFPYTVQVYAGVNEMLPSANLESNVVESITKSIPKYIPGTITEMVSSANARVVVMRATGAASVLYLYNFLWEGTQKVQGAWHRWLLPDPTDHVFLRNGRLYVWTATAAGARLNEYRLDRPVLGGIGYSPCLDYSQDVTGPVVTLDRNDYAFIGYNAGTVYEPGRRVTPDSVVADGDDWVYTMPEGAGTSLLAGVIFETKLGPNAPIAKDWRGNKDPTCSLVVHKYLADYVDSGAITAQMDNIHRGGVSYVNTSDTFPTDDNPEDSLAIAVRSGSFEIPWGEDGKIGKLLLLTQDVTPASYIEVRWHGQQFKGNR